MAGRRMREYPKTLDLQVRALAISPSILSVLEQTGAETVLDLVSQTLDMWDTEAQPSSYEQACPGHLLQVLTADQREGLRCAVLARVPLQDILALAAPAVQNGGPWRSALAEAACGRAQAGFHLEDILPNTDPSENVLGLYAEAMEGPEKRPGYREMSEQQQALVRTVACLASMGAVPPVAPFESKPMDRAILKRLFQERYAKPYALRILQADFPGLTMEQLDTALDDVLLRIGAACFALLHMAPPAEMEMPLPDKDDSKQGRNQRLAYEVFTQPDSLDGLIRRLYPKAVEGWTRPDMPNYWYWVHCVLKSVLDDLDIDFQDCELLLFYLEPGDPRMRDVASLLGAPLPHVLKLQKDVLKRVRAAGVRSLILDGCPHGSKLEWMMLPMVPSGKVPNVPLYLLNLGRDVVRKLSGVSYMSSVAALGSALWGDQLTWSAEFRKVLGPKTFYSLRAYFYYLGWGTWLKQLSETECFREGQSACIMSRILSENPKTARFQTENALPTVLLSGFTCARRVLLGFQRVPGYEPTEANYMLLVGRIIYWMRFDFLRDALRRRGLEVPEDVAGRYRSIVEVLAPVILEATKSGLKNKNLSRAKQDAAADALSALFHRPSYI